MSPAFLALTFLAAVGPPGPLRAAGEKRPARPWVVVRTADGLVMGRNLRYSDGQFRLDGGGQPLAVDEEKVLRITLVRAPEGLRMAPGRRGPEGRLSAVATMALRVAAAVKRSDDRRPPRRRLWLTLPEGTFILPEESVPDMFRRFVLAVEEPELAAALCGEVVRRCMVEGKPEVAVGLFREAEEMLRGKPRVALVYGVMEAALLHGLDRGEEGRATFARLASSYPGFRRLAEELRGLLERRGQPPQWPRPFGPGRKPQ